MKYKSNNIFKTNSMQLFYMLCLYFLSILVIYSVTQLLNINNILGLIEVVSLVIPIIYISKKDKSKMLISIFLILTVLLPFISSKTYDLTIDGNTYHKGAIAFIKNGWNPFYDKIKDFQKTNDKIIKIEDGSKMDLWIEHYPKATWIIAAVMYNLTGSIEAGKCITIILSIMAFIISYNILRKILDKKWSIFMSLFLILNPIVLSQIFSYYVDGIMGICFLIQLLLLFEINPMKEQNKKIWISIVAITAIFSNLKFTGLMCSGIISAIFYFYWLFKYHKEKEFLEKFKKITYYFIGVYVVAIFLVGSNSYIRNTIDHHNPLYPLIGKDKVDIVTTMQPKQFNNMNHFQKFLYSLFSKTENTTYDMGLPKLKYPYKLYKSEIEALVAPDVRIGGFGPLFTFSFLISLILFIPSIIILYKNEKDKIKYVIITLASIIITMIMLGESWWARYVPQLYLSVIGIFILNIYVSKYIKNKYLNYIKYIPIIIMVINIGIFVYSASNNLKIFKEIDKDLEYMKNKKNLIVEIDKEQHGYQYVLKDKGIKYKLVDEIAEDETLYKYSWRVRVKQ